MRDHSKHIQLTREEAVEAILREAPPTPRTETVGLHEAVNRVTAADCPALVDVPNALCAQMDGIAVRFADFAGGVPDTSGWQLDRDYGWANTGTAIPAGFDAAIAVEQVDFSADGTPTPREAPRETGANCRLPGSDFAKGETVVPARTWLSPTAVSALAMCGYGSVEVVCKPKVAFIPTGDELVEPGGPLPDGMAFDSNSILLEGKLSCWGAQPLMHRCLPDDWDAIRAAILDACRTADIVALNAGSSKGSKDINMEVLEELGRVLCHETNHGPGRHSSMAVVEGTPVVGLSGPPGGCEITADWYLKPVVDAYLFGAPQGFDHVVAKLGAPLKPGRGHGPAGPGGPGRGGGDAAPGRDFFVIRPVRLECTPDGLVAWPISSQRHANLAELDLADGYVEAPPRDIAQMLPGNPVRVELRHPYRATF